MKTDDLFSKKKIQNKVRMEERDSPPSSLSSRHSHEDDEDKMEAEEFMKYTKDSRAGSPAPPSTTTKVQSNQCPTPYFSCFFVLRKRKRNQRRKHRLRLILGNLRSPEHQGQVRDTRIVIFIQLQEFPTPPHCCCCSVTKRSDSGIAEVFKALKMHF